MGKHHPRQGFQLRHHFNPRHCPVKVSRDINQARLILLRSKQEITHLPNRAQKALAAIEGAAPNKVTFWAGMPRDLLVDLLIAQLIDDAGCYLQCPMSPCFATLLPAVNRCPLLAGTL
jgi:hypothetical protein